MFVLISTLLLLIGAQFTASGRINIVTSPSNSCPGERNGIYCLTLQQFVSSQISFPNLTLELESGVHTLATYLYVTGTNYHLEIIGSNATVVCTSEHNSYYYHYSLEVRQLQSFSVSGITFVNCSSIYTYSVQRVTVSESTFVNRLYSRDLEIWYARNVSIHSCTFIHRRTGGSTGTGLYLYGLQASGMYSINSCTFSGKYIGLQLHYSFFSSPNIFIQYCNFSENRFGIRVTSSNFNTSINSCSFVGNYQSVYLYRSVDATIDNCTFRNNGINNNYAGSVIYSMGQNLVLTQSALINNTASQGAIYMRSRYQHIVSRVIIDRCTVINNLAYGTGGALYLDLSINNNPRYPSNCTINQSVFINNRATVSGGAINSIGNLSIVNSTFGYNSAPQCSVLNVRSSSVQFSISLVSNTFLLNKAVNSTNATNSHFEIGGVACFRDATVSISNGTFSHNMAAGDGGVINAEGSDISINSSIFHNNTAGIDGGVLYTRLFPTNFTITGSSFTHNRAGDDGGVMYSGGSDGNSISISSSTFNHNSASDRGGAIIAFRGTFGIAATNLVNNRATRGNDMAICGAPIISTPTYLTFFLMQTHSTDPLCWFYATHYYATSSNVPTPEDRSNLDIDHYLRLPGAVSNRSFAVSAPLAIIATTSMTTTSAEEQPLKELEKKLTETSVVSYIFFSLVLILIIALITIFVVKLCSARKAKMHLSQTVKYQNKESYARNDYNDDIEIYEEPTWNDSQPSNAIKLKPNVVYSKNKT